MAGAGIKDRETRLTLLRVRPQPAGGGRDGYLTTPDVKPGLRLGGLISFFKKQ
jgi:hypothetical protein